MFRLIYKSLQHLKSKPLANHNIYLLSTSTANCTRKGSNLEDAKSLVFAYLLNSCGLSVESATTASKKLRFDTIDKPDLVLKLLKAHGLTQTHIKNLVTAHPLLLLNDVDKSLKPNLDLLEKLGCSGSVLNDVVRKCPYILQINVPTVVDWFRGYGFSEKQIAAIVSKRPVLCTYDREKKIKPKLEFFKSLGISGEQITRLVVSNPSILQRSLENHIIPAVQAIKRIVGSDENAVKVINACCRVLRINPKEVIEPKVAVLMSHGVPESIIVHFLVRNPRAFLQSHERLTEAVEKAKRLCLDPDTMLFTLAVRVMTTIEMAHWESKIRLYSGFGMSADEVISAFKIQPACMEISEKKISKMMDFYVNELKMKLSFIAANSNLLLLSLEKRIIPRCSILNLLMSKKLIKNNTSLVRSLRISEKMFMEKFVSKFSPVVPQVVELHQGKMQVQGFPFISMASSSSSKRHLIDEDEVHKEEDEEFEGDADPNNNFDEDFKNL